MLPMVESYAEEKQRKSNAITRICTTVKGVVNHNFGYPRGAYKGCTFVKATKEFALKGKDVLQTHAVRTFILVFFNNEQHYHIRLSALGFRPSKAYCLMGFL